MMQGARVLLIVGGGIAAFKALELVRLLRREGAEVRGVLTAGGAKFITALSLGALTEQPVHDDLWSLKDETEMGHIRLSREADLILIVPASASRIARMAAGLGEDLADAVYLAADKPVLIAPAMNWRMWAHAATQRNLEQLDADGVLILEPGEGAMACGEVGVGRLPEPERIVEAARAVLEGRLDVPGLLPSRFHAPPHASDPRFANGMAPARPLDGRHAVVTAGPTHEPIDPVRYVGNRSSGTQGFAIAGALAALGALVTLVAGPVALPTPSGCARVDVTTAREMAAAVDAALPADIAVMVAAVADWGIEAPAPRKLKKANGPPAIQLVPNPDILATVAAPGPRRPRLVVGFAAETCDPETNAATKRATKGADWIVANDVSGDVMGGPANSVAIIDGTGIERWPKLPKAEVARRLAARIAAAIATADEPALQDLT